MDFITVGGLPLHPLVVHLVVVVVPMTFAGAVLMAVWPKFSRRFGPLIAIGAGLGIIGGFVAKEAGEQLAPSVGVTAEHLAWGQRAPLWIAFFGISVIAFWLVDRGIPANRSRPVWVHVFAGVMVLLGVIALIQVLGAGHSGSQSLWTPLLH